MSNQVIQKYIQYFKSLNVNKTKIRGEAPHKPILLLSVIDGIEAGWIKSPIIEISPQLVAVFKKRWAELVFNDAHKPRFVLPFFHLRKEKFWRLNARTSINPYLQNRSISSFKQLNNAIESATIDLALFELLLDEQSRTLLRKAIISRYFPNNLSLLASSTILNSIENQILKEDVEYYDKVVSSDSKNENEFIRGGLFKSIVPKIYTYKCCISEMSVTTTSSISMLDACHIVPFSIGGNDKITNGISLCPNLHRAFDRGLITINNNYEVVMSKHFIENADSNYNIKQFDGKTILLPQNIEYRPSIAYLNWHTENVFKA